MEYQIVRGYDNSDVVDFYLGIIYESLKKAGYNLEYINNLAMSKKEATIVV